MENEKLRQLLKEVELSKEQAKQNLSTCELLKNDKMTNINRGYIIACSDIEKTIKEFLNE